MVEVGIHSVKNGMLYRKIARVLGLNVSFFQEVLRLSISGSGHVVADQCSVFLRAKIYTRRLGKNFIAILQRYSVMPLIKLLSHSVNIMLR